MELGHVKKQLERENRTLVLALTQERGAKRAAHEHTNVHCRGWHQVRLACMKGGQMRGSWRARIGVVEQGHKMPTLVSVHV